MYKSFIKLLTALIIPLVLFVPPEAYATLTGANYEIDMGVVDSGGGIRYGSDYATDEAIGQPVQGDNTGSLNRYQALTGYIYYDNRSPIFPERGSTDPTFTSWMQAINSTTSRFFTHVVEDLQSGDKATGLLVNPAFVYYKASINSTPGSWQCSDGTIVGDDDLDPSTWCRFSDAVVASNAIVTGTNGTLTTETLEISIDFAAPISEFTSVKFKMLDRAGNVAFSDDLNILPWLKTIGSDVHSMRNITMFAAPPQQVEIDITTNSVGDSVYRVPCNLGALDPDLCPFDYADDPSPDQINGGLDPTWKSDPGFVAPWVPAIAVNYVSWGRPPWDLPGGTSPISTGSQDNNNISNLGRKIFQADPAKNVVRATLEIFADNTSFWYINGTLVLGPASGGVRTVNITSEVQSGNNLLAFQATNAWHSYRNTHPFGYSYRIVIEYADPAADDQTNATYLVSAGTYDPDTGDLQSGTGVISDFESEAEWEIPLYAATINWPAIEYGNLITQATPIINIPATIQDNTIYYCENSLAISADISGVVDAGAATIIVGDTLNINSDITLPNGGYIAFLVQGNINVGGSVTELHGTYFADYKTVDGSPNYNTGIIDSGTSGQQLVVYGQFIARNGFRLNRTFAGEGQVGTDPSQTDVLAPAELIIFDPQIILNTPPGLKELPSLGGWQEVTP